MTKLRESHERALSSSLFVIEDNLQRIRTLLKEGNPSEQTITYHRVDNIDPKSKHRIINVIADMPMKSMRT
jgi:ribulose bisphosphate carboxylase small subunit